MCSKIHSPDLPSSPPFMILSMDHQMNESLLKMNASRLQENLHMDYYSRFSARSSPPPPVHAQLQHQQHLHHHHLQHQQQLLHPRYEAEFYVYEVEFKRGKERFEKSIACREDFDLGDFVRVENDRGFEIGVVCHRSIQSSSSLPFFSQNGHPNLRKIVGRANDHEKKYLQMKVRDESRALHICNELAARRSLPILMLDAEFQTDRNKLTFLYISDVRVDFRELVRDLFSLFKTRIWMQKLDIHGKPIHSSMPSGDPNGPPALPQLQHLFARYGRDDLATLSYSALSMPSLEAHYGGENFASSGFLQEDFLAGVNWSGSDLAPEAEPYIPNSYSSTPPIAELQLESRHQSSPPIAAPIMHQTRVESRRNSILKHPSGPKISPSSATSIHFFSDHEGGMEERNYHTAPYNSNSGKKTISPGLFPLGYSPSTVIASPMLPPQYPNSNPTNHYTLSSQSKNHPNHVTHSSTATAPISGIRISPRSQAQQSEYGTGFYTTVTGPYDLLSTAYSRSTDSTFSDNHRSSDENDMTTTGPFVFE